MADDYIRVPIADVVAIGDDPITGWAYVQLWEGYWRRRRDGPPQLPGPESLPRKSRDKLVAIERLRLVAGGRYVIPAQEAYDQKVSAKNARPHDPVTGRLAKSEPPVGSPSGEPEWGGLAEQPGAPVGSPIVEPLVKSESESKEWEHVFEGEEGQTAVPSGDPGRAWPLGELATVKDLELPEPDEEPVDLDTGELLGERPCQGCGRPRHPGKTCDQDQGPR